MPGRDVTLDALAAAVSEAGARAMAYWGVDNTALRHWEKVPGQPVSNADLLVDEHLKQTLGALAPDAAWLSEETADDPVRMGSDRLWLVDPIDGTRDFVRGRPGWAVSVALVDQGEVMLAALAAPARDELWLAAKGQGATRNSVALRASTRTQLPGARVPADQLPRVDADLATVFKPNSIALRMAMVAADEADLVATVRWGAEWDIAASSLIAQESGAVVTDALGQRLIFNREKPVALGMLCCAPAIHDAAVARLRERALGILRDG
ncbi:3'(2'),5'-bisphosphate nucleotidase CysQ [Sphingobium sufflavum]|uniref:inositol monophosphatase family protein n=1 Tax=Sphingobium sufflavum TaxID=1129547 RepID=UPI001F2D9787|nr:3'(2'),5'-bisphosphate nucleotidase CysQ [Sphingobium sufflavum]MCE7795326.1 3'(2'),5'-bisphosphate nucleotidase CysQ [Sphingobium sufflavum]